MILATYTNLSIPSNNGHSAGEGMLTTHFREARGSMEVDGKKASASDFSSQEAVTPQAPPCLLEIPGLCNRKITSMEKTAQQK